MDLILSHQVEFLQIEMNNHKITVFKKQIKRQI